MEVIVHPSPQLNVEFVANIAGAAIPKQVNSDWNESDPASKAYIKNKPTKLSQFENDKAFIVNTVDNLVNYYKKTDTYSKSEIAALISQIPTLNTKVVDELPSSGVEKTIYLVPNEKSAANNVRDEYLWLDGKWELIGSTAVDLTGVVRYENTSEIPSVVDPVLGNLLTKSAQKLTPEEQMQVQTNVGVKDTVDAVGAGKTEAKTIEIGQDGYYRYIDLNGEAISSTPHFISKPIEVKRGDIIMGQAYGTKSMSIVTKVTSSGEAIKPLFRDTTATATTQIIFRCIIDSDGYVDISSTKTRLSDTSLVIIPCNLVKELAIPEGGYNRALFEAAGAVYDEEKHCWLLNELELTDTEMAAVYQAYSGEAKYDYGSALANTKVRTNIPLKQKQGVVSMAAAFNASTIEVADFKCTTSDLSRCFQKCANLRKIANPHSLEYITTDSKISYCFLGCTSLQNFYFHSLKVNLNISDSPLLTVDDVAGSALNYLITNAKNTGPITITLHPDAYARVPESLKQKATEKQISIASA